MNKIKEIEKKLTNNYKFNILNINGEFLSGKTDLVNQLTNTENTYKEYDFVTFVDDWHKFNYSFDISEEIINNSNISSQLSDKGELKYFSTSFIDNLNAINLANKDTFNFIVERLHLYNPHQIDSHYEEFVNKNVNNALKKVLALKSFEISIESLLADLFNYYYPIKEGMNNVSEYLIDRNPIKLLFIYDNLQILNPKIIKWLDLFNFYLTNKKITDFIIFEYEGDGSDIHIGEFFDIDFIIISRDKEYIYSHPDFNVNKVVTEYSKSDNNLYNSFPYNSIDLLIQYKESNNEITELDVCVQAVSELIKYAPEENQKQIIFSSLFETFDLLNFNLIDEYQISNSEFESLIFNLDFVNKSNEAYFIVKKYRKYFKTLAIELFPTINPIELGEVIDSLRKSLPSINYNEFNLIRLLSYFEKFEKPFIINNLFEENINISDTIEKYIFLFDRKSNILSLKTKYRVLFNKYNEIKDQPNIENILEKVNSIKELYKQEIYNRNEILSNDVVGVGEELDKLKSELGMMNVEINNKSKSLISIKNNIKTIDTKLKPFTNRNTNRKKTLNIVALITSVAIIFNSDRISELLFSTKDNFDYIIMIVLLLLLILYSNGLIRYFRSKIQSEEIYILKKERKFNLEKKESLVNKIELLNADVRAKEAKISDLKQHIDRANNQILENKKKIIFD